MLDHPDAVSLALFAVGLASTGTVLWVSSRRVDRKERERSQFMRMRSRLNQLMRERSYALTLLFAAGALIAMLSLTQFLVRRSMDDGQGSN